MMTRAMALQIGRGNLYRLVDKIAEKELFDGSGCMKDWGKAIAIVELIDAIEDLDNIPFYYSDKDEKCLLHKLVNTK